MGRGTSWSSQELADLAKSLLSASADPIAGIDQTTARFAATLHNAFIDNACNEEEGGKRYEAISAKYVKDLFETLRCTYKTAKRVVQL